MPRSIDLRVAYSPLLDPECPKVCAHEDCDEPIIFTTSGWINDHAHGPGSEPVVYHSCPSHQRDCMAAIMRELTEALLVIQNMEDEKGGEI